MFSHIQQTSGFSISSVREAGTTRRGSSSHSSSWRPTSSAALMLIVLLATATATTAFSINMAASSSSTYKPPVKSSVKKLYDQRFGDSSSVRRTPGSNRRSSQTAKSATYSSTLPSNQTQQSFEQRMRNMVMGRGGAAAARGAASSPVRRRPQQQQLRTTANTNVQVIENLQDYKLVVGDEREQIVVVRFHATYCKACKAVAPHFYKLADTYRQVKFVDVPVTAKNAKLHQGLGIPSLPYVHCYHPELGLVQEQRFTRPDVKGFRDTLQSYVTGSCPIQFEEEL